MPPKKTTTAAKPAAKTQGPTYEDMIKDAILNLKDRKGSSRPSLKKYVQANNKVASGATFDKLFNNALSKGVTKGLFAQPKGPSGGTKLAQPTKISADEKKPAAEKPAAKPAAKKTATAAKKAGAPKKAAAAKKTTKAAAAAPKKAAATKKAPAKAAPVKKAAAKKTGPKKAAPAPAIENRPIITGKTKGGRITKTTQKSAPPVAKKVTKIPAKSKATPKKATPKKA